MKVRVGGGGGHIRQSHRALFTLAISCATVTGAGPIAGHCSNGAVPSAMATASTRSLMATRPTPRQSPTHVCAAAGAAAASSHSAVSAAASRRRRRRGCIVAPRVMMVAV